MFDTNLRNMFSKRDFRCVDILSVCLTCKTFVGRNVFKTMTDSLLRALIANRGKTVLAK